MAVDRNSKEFQEKVMKYKKIKIAIELVIIAAIIVVAVASM